MIQFKHSEENLQKLRTVEVANYRKWIELKLHVDNNEVKTTKYGYMGMTVKVSKCGYMGMIVK